MTLPDDLSLHLIIRRHSLIPIDLSTAMDHTQQVVRLQQEREAVLASLAFINNCGRQLHALSSSLDTLPPVSTATSGSDGSDNAEDSDDFELTPPDTPVSYVVYHHL
jgi:hypothetical protein